MADEPTDTTESLEGSEAPEKDSPDKPDETATPTEDNSLGKATGPDSDNPPPKPPLWQRILGYSHRYVILLILLLLVVGAIIVIAVKSSPDNSKKNQQAQTLTDSQIAQLKGSTTLVGDSQQLLDVQSSSVFEGPVLLRKDLEVAGTVKVGGSLDLPAITVGGSSSFGELEVSKNLTVAGTTTLQGVSVRGSLTVAGPASFSSSLSVGQLAVTNLQLNGDLSLNRHVLVSGGVPGKTNGSALGSGGTASVNGADSGGTVTINTGGSASNGCYVTIRFVHAYAKTPHVVISPSNSSAANLAYYTNRNTGSFSICSVSGRSNSTTYIFDYYVID